MEYEIINGQIAKATKLNIAFHRSRTKVSIPRIFFEIVASVNVSSV